MTVTSAMRSVVSSMAATCNPHDMHLPSMSATMDRFERMTEHLGARQTCATEALGGVTAAVVNAEQVDSLMARIVDRAGLDVRSVMPAALAEYSSLQQNMSSSSPPPPPQDLILGLDEQLAKLRNIYG
ncbi:charged multivesicular body protein 1b-like [Rhopalosiphum padi]|uniref:charged multivesicular body protein 1b-like n=1 Tax=Rhopalosiphum padi TaxID=40932 RepID=UPI00298EC6E5|nr:charged multivesicular body protein 1b-like [Rhopalosiphum padi]